MLLRLFRKLPRRLQLTLYFRLLSKHRRRFRGLYESAPLKYAPPMRMRLSSADLFHGQIAFMGIYEEELSRRIQSLSRDPGGLMIDVGANYGYFSLLWCGGRPENRVAAIEASPLNLPVLLQNVAENDLAGRIATHAWAASNQQGLASFDLGSLEETGWGGLANHQAKHVVPVESRRLDQEFAGERVELLKVDCEGADAWVLEGASGLLNASLIRNVVFEENLARQKALGIREGHAVSLLTGHGYTCRLLDDDDPWIKSYHAVRGA